MAADKKTNTNEISNASCEERSDEAIPSKKEIGMPFGLAMTGKDNYSVGINSEHGYLLDRRGAQ